MKDDKEKWIESVFDSLEGSQRAKPDASLFAKIKRRIDAPEAKVVSMSQWRMAVAAAVALLFLNVFAIQQYAKSSELTSSEMVTEGASDQQLISNYKLYE